MLKVLYLPLGGQPGTTDAWNEVGVQLQIYDYWTDWLQNNSRDLIKQRFLQKVQEFQPNLIHMQLQMTGLMNSDTISQARAMCPGVVITNWSGDVRAHAPTEFTSIAGALDYTLISSTGQLEMYKQAGCHNIKYWQIGYDPKRHYPSNYSDFKYDISFIANNYGQMFPDGNLRLQAVNKCIQTFGNRFGCFGASWPNNSKSIDINDVNEVYNRSICALSISNFNSISHYFSDRLLYCLASGRPTISWYFPGYEDYFVDGRDIFIAHSNEQIVDIVNYCKSNPEIATQVGINGQKKVLKEHTYLSRIIELLHITNLIDRV